jgi:hypothetical protein
MKKILLSIAAMLLFNNCEKNNKDEIVIKLKASKQGEPLAQVGKITLSLDEMREDFLERQGTFRGAPHLNTEKKRSEYVENQTLQWALFQEAVALGYFEKDLEVKRNIIKMTVQKLMRDKLNAAQESYVPNETEMKEYYDKNPLHFNREEALKVAYIAIPFGADQKAALSVAQTLYKEAQNKIKDNNVKEFARLAINFAQKGASSSGKLETNESDYLEQVAFDTKFGKDTFNKIHALENIGQIGPLLSTDTSFYIVMKTGQRKKLNETFEDAKDKITQRIAFEKRGEVYEKYLAEVREKYKIKIYEERIAELSNDPKAKANAQASGPDAHVKPAAEAASN